MTTFGPPSFSFDGGTNLLDQKRAVADFYRLTSMDAGPNGSGITVTGAQNSQINGYQIAASSTWFSVVPNGGAAVLPETSTPNLLTGLAGVTVTILNTGSNTLNVYVNPGDTAGGINGGIQTSPVAVLPGVFAILHCIQPGFWVAAGPTGGGGAVSSVFGRTGIVVANANDYSFSQISGQATLAQLPTIANNTVLGNVSGGATTPIALNQAQHTAMLNAFTSGLQGVVPASGGGTLNFLRADGTWSPNTITVNSSGVANGTGGILYNTGGVVKEVVIGAGLSFSGGILVNTGGGGGGGTPGGSNTQVQYNNAGSFGGTGGITVNATTVTSMTLGAMTVALGADATGDIYFNNGAGVFTRLAVGGAGGLLTVSGGKPAWGGITIGSTTISGGTTQRLLYDNAGAIGELILGTNLSITSGTLNAAGGGGGTPGGANTDVQFNNSSAFGGDGGFTYAGNGQATLALGTITTNLKALSITGTWNAAVTFDAPLLMNITNTSSNAGSLLADFQLGGTSVLQIGRPTSSSDRSLILNGGGFGGGSDRTYIFFNNVGTSSYSSIFTFNSGTLGSTTERWSLGNDLQSTKADDFFLYNDGNGTTPIWVRGGSIKQIVAPNNWSFGFSSGSSLPLGSPDTSIYRDAAIGVLALGDPNSGSTATGFRVYNSTDNVGTGTAPTNYSRGVFDFITTASVLTIGTQQGGSGAFPNMTFVTAGGTMNFTNLNNASWFDTGAPNLILQLYAPNKFLQLPNNYIFGWNSAGSVSGNPDAAFYRASAGVVGVGQGTSGDVASPVASLGMKVQGALAGNANVAASNFTQTGSLSTGTGLPGNWALYTGFTGFPAGGTCTISNASPAVITFNNHGFVNNEPVLFQTTGSLPTGLNTLQTYYTIAVATNTFEVSASYQGGAVNTSSAGSGTQTVVPGGVCTISNASPAVITCTNHGLVPGCIVQFSANGGALPTGLSAATNYYVSQTDCTQNWFNVSATLNGALINTSSAGSGTFTFLIQGGTTQNQSPQPLISFGPTGLTGAQGSGKGILIQQNWNTTSLPDPVVRIICQNINAGWINNGNVGNFTAFDVQLNAQPGIVGGTNNAGIFPVFAVRGDGSIHLGSNLGADGFGAGGTNIWGGVSNSGGIFVINAGGNSNYNAAFNGNFGWVFSASQGGLNWSTGGVNQNSLNTMDVGLYRMQAQTIALLNTSTKTSPTGFQVYNTTDTIGGTPTNYERATMDWNTTSNVLTIGSQSGGTGTGREVNIVASITGPAETGVHIKMANTTNNNAKLWVDCTGGCTAVGINLAESGTAKWTFGSFNNGHTNRDLLFYNPQNSTSVWTINGDNNQVNFFSSSNLNLGFTSSSLGAPDTGINRVQAALIEIATGSAAGVAYLRLNGVATASLPAASATYKGARGTVTDSNATLTAGIGAVVAAGGANIVPVFCDGTNWRIG